MTSYERVSLDELKNSPSFGGFKLPCVETMCRSLLSSQCIRLLCSGDRKSIGYIDFWMGDLLKDVIPELGQVAGARKTPDYFLKISESLTDIMLSELLTADSLPEISNKKIYNDLADIPAPKVVADYPLVNYKVVWKRLQYWSLASEEYECLFLLIHNKLPVLERLHRVGLREDPFCQLCPGQQISDTLHYFTSCQRTKAIWDWVKLQVNQVSDTYLSSNWEFINLCFTGSKNEETVVWLIGMYVNYVWMSLNDSSVEFEKFFGFLTFKYKEINATIGTINALLA